MTERRSRPRRGLTRRELLEAGAVAGLAIGAGLAGCRTSSGPPASSRDRFAHGVASGDPLADRVVLWTRVAGETADDVEVRWRVARDPALRDVVVRGVAATSAARDYTVKVDVPGLEPGRTFYYAFESLGAASPVGRTRTLPAGATPRVRLASCSCANHPQGHFNVYAAMARADVDAVLHLGDYIYEYGRDGYGASAIGRDAEPPHEILTLADYRTRYAQYRRDPDLQELHRQHPMIAVWDDHEIANDAFHGGAQNHDAATEGAWSVRRAAAVQAWREWLPIREAAGGADAAPRIWRAFRFGDLVDLAMLDARLVGRDAQAPRTDAARIAAPERQLLGATQEPWLLDWLDASRAAWRVLGQQIVFSPWARPPRPPNPDGWDGYPAARARVLDRIEARGIRDLVILSGDVHSSWAMEVARDPFSPRAYDPKTSRGALAIEFVAPAVASSPLAVFPQAAERFGRSLEELPHLRWFDIERRGFVLTDYDAERVQAEWWHADGVASREEAVRFAAAFRCARGTSRLERVAEPVPARANAPALA